MPKDYRCQLCIYLKSKASIFRKKTLNVLFGLEYQVIKMYLKYLLGLDRNVLEGLPIKEQVTSKATAGVSALVRSLNVFVGCL